LAKAREIEEIYAREMPEARPLIKRRDAFGDVQSAMTIAIVLTTCTRVKHRGYVKTVLGRRSRFPTDYKIHKALNSIIQGSAADIMKTKLVELHAKRKELGFTMRMTVHDEVTGDVPDVETAKRIEDVLNVQSIEMLVPILWSTGTGKNWAEAK
jgi:DNA polymerase I-like protein with 3'-5' exonuclease and polymerase domains